MKLIFSARILLYIAIDAIKTCAAQGSSRMKSLSSCVISGCFIFLSVLNNQASARYSYTSLIPDDSIRFKSLKVGDTIPEELWNMPLQAMNHPNSEEFVTLSNYKDKLIILDFWATWCAPCIRDLPHLLALEDSIDCKVIPLSDEPKAKIVSFLSSNPSFQKFSFYKYDRNSIIDKSFERYSIPHTVVIYKGKVITFTFPHLISSKNLRDIMDGDSEALTPKIELRHNKEDLFALASVDLDKMNTAGFSIFLESIEGVVPGVFWEPKLSNGGAKFQIANYPLISIIALATGKGGIFLKNPNKVLVEDTRGIRQIEADEWDFLKTKKFCYESRYPNPLPYSEVVSVLQKDLSLYKNIDCRIDTVSLHVEKFIKKRNLEVEPTKFQYKISEIVFVLNQTPKAISYDFDPKDKNQIVYLSEQLENIDKNSITKLLIQQGWSKKKEHRAEGCLIISGRGLKNEIDKL